ncbi:MAG TPA: Hint domain-containing protein [Acidocella sp.]|jgi:hypothetical protein|nr:Hint domain-containing protein [Acidocella sp.]
MAAANIWQGPSGGDTPELVATDSTGGNGHRTVYNLETSSGSSIPAFMAGTRLATEDGEIAVEDAVPGTRLRLADGRIAEVCWLGWREIWTRFADPLRAFPIRILAGALADGMPARDLRVSPGHAIFLDGLLVQASALVNGVSIVRETDMPESFRYYHVELATHELLLAESCPAESFADNIDRMNFHNWDQRETPTEPVVEMELPCAKLARQLPAALCNVLAARAEAFASHHAA